MNHISSCEYDNKTDSKIQEIYIKLEQLRKNKRLVTTPEELEALEREIRALTDQLASLINIRTEDSRIFRFRRIA